MRIRIINLIFFIFCIFLFCYNTVYGENNITWNDVSYTGYYETKYDEARARSIDHALDMIEKGDSLPQRKAYSASNPYDDQISKYIYDDYKPSDKKKSISDDSNNRYGKFLSRKNKLSKLDLSLESSYYLYKEKGTLEEDGFFYGASGSYTYRLSENEHIKSLKDVFSDTNKINMFRLEGRVGIGKVDLESEQSGPFSSPRDFQTQISGSANDIRDYYYEVRGLVGYDIPFNTKARLTPFSGLGYGYVHDDFADKTTSTGNWGFDRDQMYFYLPIGVEYHTELISRWMLDFTLEYDMFLSGKHKSHLEDGGKTVLSANDGKWYAIDNLINEQDKGYGLRASMKIMKVSDYMDFFIEPFIRVWKIDRSDSKQLSSEKGSILWYWDTEYTNPVLSATPKIKSYEYGLKLGLSY